MSEPLRVQKALSAAGLMSRRRAEELIAAGRVTVDGGVVRLGDRVDPEAATVAVDGIPVPVAPGRVSYVLYKPVGTISTVSDPQGRRTVVDLVPAEPRVWPVGRLDADSEGLLVLTNDGELTNRLTHPRYGVPKTYEVLVGGEPTRRTIRALIEGVDLDDGPARAASARILARHRGRTLVEMIMGEGRKREIRRMWEGLGFEVERLVRVAIGPLSDRSLRPGTWRPLTVAEIADLYRTAGGDSGGGRPSGGGRLR